MIMEQLKRGRGGELFETIIQVDTKLRESPAFGKPITSYAAGSRAAQQYRALAEELVRIEVKPESKAQGETEAGAQPAAALAVETEAYR